MPRPFPRSRTARRSRTGSRKRRGATYDEYNGSSWSSSFPRERLDVLGHTGTKVQVAPELYNESARNGVEFRQTFHIEAGFSDVVFAAPSPRLVETDKLLIREPDGTVRVAGGSGSGFGKGAVYSVCSRSLAVTEYT